MKKTIRKDWLRRTMLVSVTAACTLGMGLPAAATDGEGSALEDMTFDMPEEDFSPYIVRGVGPGVQIFQGPGYDESYTDTIRDVGAFTIVEEQRDSEGNLWGRLKSGIGWIDLDALKKDQEKEMPLKAFFGEEKWLAAQKGKIYSMEDSEDTVDVVFLPEEEITDIRLLALQYEEGGYQVSREFCSVSELSPEEVFVAEVVFGGDMTAYGLSFTDAQGEERTYAVWISGRNGSLLLEELTLEQSQFVFLDGEVLEDESL